MNNSGIDYSTRTQLFTTVCLLLCIHFIALLTCYIRIVRIYYMMIKCLYIFNVHCMSYIV